MKKAFTMIELIFVIVIIGILAGVALSKFVATRDDAQSVVLSGQIKDGTQELINYYTSQGGEINFSKIKETSQISFNELIKKGWAKVIDDKKAVVYSDKRNKTVCLTYKTDGYQVQIEGNSSNDSTLCQTLKKLVKDRNYSILTNNIKY